MSVTDILLVIFIALAAVAMVGQWLAMQGLARRISTLADKVEPLLPQVQSLITETRPKLDTVATNLAEMTTLARDQMRRADAFATDFGARLELQMVRVDEALGSCLTTVDTIANAVRQTVLRPMQDANALVHGLRTGLDFFFRRRSGPGARPVYQDEEMFI
jgi:hypothetical protein